MNYIVKNDELKTLYDYILSKGITTDDYENFISPNKTNLLNPYDLNNIVEGANLLINEMNNEQSKIVIIVDSDQDGYTSAAMLYNYLNQVFPNKSIDFKIHTGKQHGLEDYIDVLEDSNYSLVILPDSSSNDYDYHRRLYEKNIKVLVIDHHEAEKVSEYATVINNQLSPNYQNKALSGAGVCYKFLQVLDDQLSVKKADDYLDLAAIGIIGDVMSLLTLENRYIIEKGLSNIKNTCIKELIKKQSYVLEDVSHITPTKIAWNITPLVNSLIRVGKQSEKEILFEAFINGDKKIQSTKRGAKKDDYETIAEQNARNCTNSKNRQNSAKEKAIEQLEMKIYKNSLNENAIIFVEIDDENINSNLTGLIAMQLLAKFHKPVIVARENDEGFLRGSARSANFKNLTDLKKFCIDSGYFEYAEGHANAHGISIPKKNLNNFIDYANEKLKDCSFSTDNYFIDFLFDYCQLNLDELKELIFEIDKNDMLWGKDIETPEIIVERIPLNKKELQILGSKKSTYKFVKNGIEFFKPYGGEEDILNIGSFDNMTITIYGTAAVNKWMGNNIPQIKIKDIEIKDSTYEF